MGVVGHPSTQVFINQNGDLINMFGIYGWETAEDCIGEEGYYDEDEAIVNANDPLRDEHDLWADGIPEKSHFDEDTEISDEYKSQFEQFSDQVHYDSRMKAIAVAGAICQSCCQPSEEDEDAAKLEEEAIEYISMEEHLENVTIDKNPGIPGVPKQAPRPFEKWVQDIKAGRKTIHDPL